MIKRCIICDAYYDAKGAAKTARQVFARDHVRGEAEQIAFIRSNQRNAPTNRPDPLPYVVKGNAVEFNRPCRMTKRDLQRLLKGMD